MNEFIKKLIGRLGEERAKMEDKRLGYEYESPWEDCYSKVKEIVNQLAEEYKLKTNANMQEVIDNLEVYTVGRLNTSKVDISVLQLQRYINRLKQIAEEYNNGWITDRNPTREECGEYGHAEFQVTIPQSKGNKTITMDFVYETVGGKEVARWKWCGRLPIWEVLAWKPLDAPYQPKGE